MADLIDMIRRDVEDDVAINARAFTVDLLTRGFLVKRKTIRVAGRVANEHERDKIAAIVNHHAGDGYEIEMNVRVEESAEA